VRRSDGVSKVVIGRCVGRTVYQGGDSAVRRPDGPPGLRSCVGRTGQRARIGRCAGGTILARYPLDTTPRQNGRFLVLTARGSGRNRAASVIGGKGRR
jgi:hypothetical protein